jgi:hypothetical protein
LYGQGGHASNVVTDFTIEFEHDALVQPLLYKSPTDFVTEFAEVAFYIVGKMGHTIAFVPVDKVFAVLLYCFRRISSNKEEPGEPRSVMFLSYASLIRLPGP